RGCFWNVRDVLRGADRDAAVCRGHTPGAATSDGAACARVAADSAGLAPPCHSTRSDTRSDATFRRRSEAHGSAQTRLHVALAATLDDRSRTRADRWRRCLSLSRVPGPRYTLLGRPKADHAGLE